MGFLPKRLTLQNLDQVSVFIEDTNNEYFNVQEVPETITQGRYAFKIFGSDFLREGIELKLELIDSEGNTIYLSPIDFIGEETPPYVPYRYVTIEVYSPPVNYGGLATLTILGEANPDVVDVPIEFQNAYNVRYTKTINVDLSTVVNTQPIRFFKNPTTEFQEVVQAKTTLTAISQSIVTGTADGFARGDLKGKIIPIETGSLEKEALPSEVSDTFKDLRRFKDEYKYKTGLRGKVPSIIRRRGLSTVYASKEEPKFVIKSGTPLFTADMQGGDVEIPERQVTITKLDTITNKLIEETVTVPKFKTKILEVVNDTTIVPEEPPTITLPTGSNPIGTDITEVTLEDFSSTALTASFNSTNTSVSQSDIHFDSLLDLTIKDMRTFSGDIYRVRVHGKSESAGSDFIVLTDVIVESPELLVDTDSASGVLRTGYFINQSHVNTYWNKFSVNGITKGSNVATTHTGSEFIDSIFISGSTHGQNESVVVENKPTKSFTLRKDVAYTLTAKVKGRPTNKTLDSNNVEKQGKLYFNISGSNLNTSKLINSHNFFGSELTEDSSGEVVVLQLDSDIDGIQNFETIEHTFKPSFKLDKTINTDTILQLRVESGEWFISDISLTPAMDTGFSPDEFKLKVPIPRSTRPDRFDFLVEYFDINNNVAETVTVIQDVPIVGSALVIDGDGNLLTGSLFLSNAVDSGVEMAGVNSAFVRSVGYEGFQSASLGGQGGFMIFSGSVLPNAPDNYQGAGIEIHDGVTGSNESFLKFRTNPSQLDIKTSKFFLGKESNPANFISGSNGNLQISSSNFELSPEGNVTMSGEITAVGGTIGGFDIASTTISTTGIILGNSAEDLFISSSKFKVDHEGNITASNIDLGGTISATSGDVGGFTINAGSLTSGTENSAITMSSANKIIAIGSGSTFNKGDLAGGFRVGIDTDGVFKFAVGSADSYLHADATGVSIKSDSFDVTASIAELDVDVFKLSANNLFISSSDGGFISAGNPRPTGIDGTNKGIFLRGNSPAALIGDANGSHIKFDGTNTSISSSEFYLGSDSQFVSGSNGNIEISSSNFHLDNSGNVAMQGTITATAGTLGGFSIGGGALSSDNFFISGSSTGNNFFISSSNFNVKASGDVTASALDLTGGQIGGIDISATSVSVGSVLQLKDNGQITGSNVLFTGGKIGGFHLTSTDLYAGNAALGNSATRIVLGDIGDGETPKFALGASANSISLAGGTGLYVDGDGDFKIGSTSKFLKYTVSTDKLEIKTGTFELDTTNLDITATGDITGSSVLFTGGKIAAWNISGNNITSVGGGIRLNGNGNNAEISVNSHTFGNEGIQFGFNSGSPRFYAGDGAQNFIRYDTSNGVNIQTTRAKISGSEITLETPKFFMGGTQQFLSGSNGNLEISSSGFHLTPEGDVSASNILLGDKGLGDFLEFNSGVLTVQGEVFANSINTPSAAPTPSASITSDGFAKFVSASIGGWGVTDSFIFKSISGSVAHQDITRVYLSATQDNAKNIGEGLQLYRKDEDVVDGGVKVVRVGGLSDTTNLHANNEYGIQVIKQISASNYDNIMYIGPTTQSIAGWNISPDGFTDSAGSVQFSSTQASMSLGTSQEVVIRGNSNSPFISLQPSVALPDKAYGEVGIMLAVAGGSTPLFSVVGSGGHIKFNGTGLDISAATVHMSGSSITLQTPKFYFGESSQYISGSNGNIEISSSNFHLTSEGNVTMSGEITAAGGTIGGFTIGDDLSSTAGTLKLKGASGQITASAAQITGKVTATSGQIAGFTIDGNTLTATNFTLDASGKRVTLGTGNNIFIADGDEGIQLGHATFGSAPFSVTKAGVLKSTSGTIGGWTLSSNTIVGSNLTLNSSGIIETNDFASGTKGFRLDSADNGIAEFENISIRGTLKTTVFEKESVNAVGGQLYVANSTTLTGSLNISASAATMSVVNATGFTGSYNNDGEILVAKKISDTGFSTEYILVQSASRDEPSSDTNFAGKLYVVRGYQSGSSGDFLGDNANQSQSLAPGQVLASTGRIGTGYIRLNANPTDTTTPYIDIVERTGSGVYDVDLKARLGDLSGLSTNRLHGTNPANAGFGLYSQNVFLEGGIVANTGSIGGINMESGKLYNGVGTHGNSNTGFYVDSGSKFSLGDKLVWDGSTLTVEGAINITGGGAVADQLAALNTATGSLESSVSSLGEATASLQSATGSLQTNITNIGVGATASASAAQTNAQNYASDVGTGAAASASAAQTNAQNYASDVGTGAAASASAAQTNAQNYAIGIGAGAAASSSAVQSNLNTVSSSTAERIMTDVSGSILSTPPSPSGQGLFLNFPHMGYYSGSEYKAFISASGGFLFKADDNNLISFGQSVSGGDGSSTKSFVLKSDNVFLSGSNVNILGERFFLGGGSQFVSGSNGNIEISSSKFHVKPDGDIVVGKVDATEGSIGGFDIGSTQISSSNGALVLNADGGITGSKFKLEGGIITSDVTIEGDLSANSISTPTGGSPLAQITSQGYAKFVSASIGGFDVSTNQINSTNNNLILKSNGQITASAAKISGAITITGGASFDTINNLESGVTALGQATASLESSVTSLGQATASLESSVTSLGEATASLQNATGSLQTNITNIGVGATASASAAQSNAQSYASDIGTGAAASASAAQSNAQSYASDVGTGAAASASAAQSNAQNYASDVGTGAAASASAAQTNAQNYASDVGTGAAASASAAQSNAESYAVGVGAGATASASAAQTNAQNYAVGVGAGAAASSSAVQANLNTVSSSTALRIMTDATGSILDIAPSPSGEGLFLNFPHMGFYGKPTITDTTYVVTAPGGAGAGYYIDGVQRATVELQVGYTYRFDTSDSSNSSHPFRFATSSDGTTYSTGVTVGSGYVDIVVTSSTPSTLYYKCTAHGGMGGQINVVDNSEYKAFISASGGFLFKADDNNLISFGQSVSGGDGSSTKSFVLKSDNVFLSGSKVNILGERFFLGGGSQFVSGSNGNIEISSSNFHLTSDGNVTMSGEITAAGGTIGGFTIGDDLDSTSGTLKLKGALGQITASAVSMSGAITATSGLIGGMKIESNSIESTADAGDGTTTIYTVTVNGSQKYVIDGVAQASLTFIPGNTYRFDQADDSNENHPLRFVQTSGGTDYYTTGVTVNGSPGSSGAYTQIAVTQATPTQLYYRCTAHGGMGGSITVDKTSPLILDGNSGQITGSRVLFDGGTIGGFELASTQINSTNDNLILKSNGQITASAAKISGAITITSGASFDSLSSLNQATASLESSVTSLGEATASLQSATGSLQTNITNIGVGATASASAAQSNAQSYAVGVGAGAATSASAAQTNAQNYAVGVGTGAAASASAAQSNAESYAVGVGAGATASASAAQTNAQNYAVGIGEGAAASSSAVQTNLNTVSSSTAERIMTDVSGSILDITPSPAGAGLYLNYPHMGFYDNSEFTAFISASGGFLFKADDNNLISFGQSVSGGDGSSTKSFVLKSDNVFLSGSNVNILGERFFLGGSGQFVSGSDGNIEISSSNFHLTTDGNVTMSGEITAAGGEIGGFTIGDDLSNSAGQTLKLKGSTGQITASAAQITGKITATSGQIAGWEVIGDVIRSTGEDSITLDGDNERISINNTTFGNDGIQLDVGGAGSTARLFVGNSGNHVKFDGSKVIIASDNFDIDATGNVSMSGNVTAAGGQIATFSITSGSIDSNASNSKRGLKLEPGTSIRGYGNTVHTTETVQGKFSFGVATVAPPVDAPPSIRFSSDYSSASAPGGGQITT
jgi:exonuclease VII small subunit